MALLSLLPILIVIIFILILRKTWKYNAALSAETYDNLKNNFDARRIMEEMNYIIEQINEYQEQIVTILVHEQSCIYYQARSLRERCTSINF